MRHCRPILPGRSDVLLHPELASHVPGACTASLRTDDISNRCTRTSALEGRQRLGCSVQRDRLKRHRPSLCFAAWPRCDAGSEVRSRRGMPPRRRSSRPGQGSQDELWCESRCFADNRAYRLLWRLCGFRVGLSTRGNKDTVSAGVRELL